jgi:MoaA/NifB/PqqE/SkfB family radical SAM enzyme
MIEYLNRMMKISDLKVGYTCNNDCIHCVVSDRRDAMVGQKKPVDRTFDECKNEIFAAKQNGAEEIVLTGGEASIREDFLDILTIIHDQCIRVNLQTNGRAFHDYEFAKKTAEFPNIYFSIALHGHNAELHDQITQKKGSFNETTSGIRNLGKLEKFVSIKLVLSRLNYKYLQEIVDLGGDLKIKHFNMTFPHGLGSARRNFFDVVPKYSEIEFYVLHALELSLKKNILFETEAIPYCFLKGFEEFASEHFLKEKKIEIRAADEYTKDWQKKKLEIKKKGKQCSKCLFSEICEGPWGEYIDNYGDSELKPIEVTAKNMMHILKKIQTIKAYRTGKVKPNRQKKTGSTNQREC